MNSTRSGDGRPKRVVFRKHKLRFYIGLNAPDTITVYHARRLKTERRINPDSAFAKEFMKCLGFPMESLPTNALENAIPKSVADNPITQRVMGYRLQNIKPPSAAFSTAQTIGCEVP
jgi:hypothetical protein